MVKRTGRKEEGEGLPPALPQEAWDREVLPFTPEQFRDSENRDACNWKNGMEEFNWLYFFLRGGT